MEDPSDLYWVSSSLTLISITFIKVGGLLKAQKYDYKDHQFLI